MKLPAIILLALLVLVGPAAAQDGGLPVDALDLRATVGFAGYALPVANAGLGRDWANARGYDNSLAWQIGRNMSTVPVRIDILHRYARALKARVEVSSAYGYAYEEAPGGWPTSVSQELLVPPSVPVSVVLAPRVCPPSAPGSPVELTLRLYMSGNQKPQREIKLSVTQLEPYYLYSLLLDGPPGATYQDPVNPGNVRGLALKPGSGADPRALSSANFTLSVERQCVTALPLTARDFAFVLADLHQVALWPAAEQEALSRFMLAGGHLCLYNANMQAWQGLPLSQGAQEVGRGYLLPVAGPVAQARSAVAEWLGGELEEFVLWCGGSTGQAPAGQRQAARYGGNERLVDTAFLSADPAAPFISHRYNYLNPVWAYRELCLSGSIEPWDFPELNLFERDLLHTSANLRVFGPQDNPAPLIPLMYFTEPPRLFSWELVLLVVLLPLGACGCAAPRRWRWAAVCAGLAALGVAGWVWWRAEPHGALIQRQVLVDADTRLSQRVERELVATMADRNGITAFSLPERTMVRRVSWDAPGAWQLDHELSAGTWRGQGGVARLAVAFDTDGASDAALPVSVQVQRDAQGRCVLRCDTSQLAADQRCYLLSPAGWSVLPGGDPSVAVSFDHTPVPVIPGVTRLQALARGSGGLLPFATWLQLRELENARMVRDVLMDGTPATQKDPVARACWTALLEQPQQHRGLLGNQALLFVPLASTGPDAATTHRFLRLAIPLTGGA